MFNVIYHNKDLDGICSGAIVKFWFETMASEAFRNEAGKLNMIGFDYGEKLPEFTKDDHIVMVDVSIPVAAMIKLARSVKSFTWIDHHISAINDFKSFKEDTGECVYPFNMSAVFQNGIAACELAWRYYFPNVPVPTVVSLLGQYDVWRNEDQTNWNEKVLPFQYGMRLMAPLVTVFPTILFQDYNGNSVKIASIIEDGAKILHYQAQQYAQACKNAFVMKYEGYRCLCLNISGANSTAFDSVYDESKHDIMLAFFFDGKDWRVSLYTTKDIDVSLIAKRFDGGGHKKAAGFKVNSYPFQYSK